MTIASGTRLGRYEIRSKLGEGGMGEVYLALDTELDRTVAIKILPEALASNQQRLQLNNFKTLFISGYDLSPDGKQIACSRGTHSTDVVLIKDFR
jgi:serine/threonine protein kinase